MKCFEIYTLLLFVVLTACKTTKQVTEENENIVPRKEQVKAIFRYDTVVKTNEFYT